MGTIISEWDHGDGGLTSCAFLKTGKEIIIANQDGLVKVSYIYTSIVLVFIVTITKSL